MKFCKYCGKQLEDNQVCDCQASVNAAQQTAAQPQQQTTVPPQPQQQPASPYAMQGAPAGDNVFVKALKNLPVLFTSFWKDSKKTISVAKNDNDYLLAGMYAFIFFIAVFLGNMFTYLAMHMFSFGRVLLTSLIMTVLIEGFYLLITAIIAKAADKSADMGKTFANSFISASIITIPASIAAIIGGLTFFISAYVGVFFWCLILLYFVVSLVLDIKEIMPNAKNHGLFVMITSLVICVAFAIILVIGVNLTVWCLQGGFMSGLMDSASSLFGGSSYSDWL